jgi:hypothetical protein
MIAPSGTLKWTGQSPRLWRATRQQSPRAKNLAKSSGLLHLASGQPGPTSAQEQETVRNMTPQLRLVVLLSPLFLVAACGGSGQHRTTRLLNERLYYQLAPNLAAGNAALQPLPDGARVTLLGPAAFQDNVAALTDKYPSARASVIEALLDPSLMRVQLGDTSALPADQKRERLQNVAQYFVDYRLGSILLPIAPPQATPAASAGTAPAGLTITISVVCPHRQSGAGYGNGQAAPTCD